MSFEVQHYIPSTPRPQRPTRPSILNRIVKNLTTEEIKSLVEIKNEYEESLSIYNKEISEWEEHKRELLREMRSDLEKEFGVTGHPKAQLLWDKAWDHAHSDGLQAIYWAYESLSELLV